MEEKTIKEINILLKEQHRNTRHDAVDIVYDVLSKHVKNDYISLQKLSDI